MSFDAATCPSPESYARHLASYIRDASTIRSRTLEQYGRAPTLDRIRRYRADHEAARGERLPPEPDFDPFSPSEPTAAEVQALACSEDAPVFDMPPWVINRAFADEAIAEVAQAFGLTLAEVRHKSREAYVVRVRALIAALLVERGASTPQVGRWLGRNHATILHACKMMPEYAKRQPAIAEAWEHFRKAWGLSGEGTPS